MPLFYHKYVNYVLAHSVNYVITLYRLAPPVAPNFSIPTTIVKGQNTLASHNALASHFSRGGEIWCLAKVVPLSKR